MGWREIKEYGFQIPSNDIGEAWLISAHENGMSLLEDKTTFKSFFENNRDKFGVSKDEQFPLLVKIITANDYLSVQVHPNDEYAKIHHNSLGKPECWYIMDCPKDAKLIYGHKATNLSSFENLMNNGEWKKLLKEVEVQRGDFLYVEPGKIHAITPGVVVYELQRSSDITYRLYDYDRVDDKGIARELHIKESLDNLTIPDSKDIIIKKQNNLKFSCDFFSFEKIKVDGDKKFIWTKQDNVKWFQFTILNGNCKINSINFTMGESAICIDNLEHLEIIGKCEIIITWT
ncbi:type I phosphomannose isomerase catalytic subunit [Spiroplasma endosymbiont of Cantharis nigra]|uniref:type I phosphomannose isomerase catalytic subunit n=1 Tax=Spiroplasma endosymbiont of Cantharis nigra TaxID=3066278 RepID=UPI0030CBED2B